MNETITRIVETAKAKGIKQSFLAGAIGGYSSKITEWKNGKSTPTDREISILAEVLGVSYEYLKAETDDPARPADSHAAVSEENRSALEIYEKFCELNDGGALTEKQAQALLVFLDNISSYVKLVLEKNK